MSLTDGMDRSHIAPAIIVSLVPGTNATTTTLTGITTKDKLISVQGVHTHHDATYGAVVQTNADYTSEFSISADDTITNSGGTDLSAGVTLVVVWLKMPPGV